METASKVKKRKMKTKITENIHEGQIVPVILVISETI